MWPPYWTAQAESDLGQAWLLDLGLVCFPRRAHKCLPVLSSAVGARACLPLFWNSGAGRVGSHLVCLCSAWCPCLMPLEVWVEGRFCLCSACRACSGAQFFVIPPEALSPSFKVLLTFLSSHFNRFQVLLISHFLSFMFLDFSIPCPLLNEAFKLSFYSYLLIFPIS